MNQENNLKVTSEILPFFEKEPRAKPNIDENNIVSKFTFSLRDLERSDPETQASKDEDGDYVLQRKGPSQAFEKSIFLEHSVSTEISLVGLQIWRAALLMADFIIHSQNLFMNKTVLELGSGVGLTSIIAGMFARQVICTDLDTGNILKLIKSNIERNKDIIKARVHVCGLDFCDLEWPSELKKKIRDADVILAADVIYDNDVTEGFVKTVIKILSMPPKKVLYFALEKRYVFTISDLDSVAPCYEHLMTCLRSEQSKPPFSEWTLTEVPLDFPQYFNYERVKQLVMYRITSSEVDS